MQDEAASGEMTRDVQDLRNQVLEMLGDTGPDAAETLQALSVGLLEVVASLGAEGEGMSGAIRSSPLKVSATGGRGAPPVADAEEAASLEAGLLAFSSSAAAVEPAEREAERMRLLEAAQNRQRTFEQQHGSMDDYHRQKQLERVSAAPATAPTRAMEPSGAAAAASAAAPREASLLDPGMARDSSMSEPSQLPLFETPPRSDPGSETNPTNSEGPASASEISGVLDSTGFFAFCRVKGPASLISQLQELGETALTDFSAVDATSPQGIGQEVLNGVSMLAPLLYGLSLLRDMPDSAGCPQCGWAIWWAGVAHFPFSVSYHTVCALKSHGLSIDDTPWRCMDQSGIHMVLTVIVLALTRCSTFAMLVVVPFNSYCIVLLWSRAKTEVRHYRFMRMGVALGVKLACFSLYADLSALMGLGICWILGVIFFGADRLFLGGWGHMMMHLLLVPISHFLLLTAVQ